MRKLLLPLLFLPAFSQPTFAAPRAGQVIWSDLQYGMTREQVYALYPKGRGVDFGNGCSAGISPEFESKQLVKVGLSGADAEVGCDTSILASLVAKYGNPRTIEVEIVDPSKGRSFVGGGLRRLVRLRQLGRNADEPFDTIRVRTWFTGDTLITLRTNETLREWSALYQPAEIRKPALTDKL